MCSFADGVCVPEIISFHTGDLTEETRGDMTEVARGDNIK